LKCVATMIISTNMHTSMLERSTSMSTSTRQSTSTDISAAINAEIEAVGKVFNYYQFYVMLQKISFALEIYVMQRSIYIPLMLILLKNSKLEVLICFRTGFNANHVLCSDQISILN
jgi:hypothetical protein